jgi:dolichol-phosphate mannosyltransferase
MEQNQPKIWVLLPVFNEAEGIIGWLTSIKLNCQEFGDVQFVLSDDGSTDGLENTISNWDEKTNCAILGDGSNRGPGAAFDLGFRYILKHGNSADLVVTLEADGTADLSMLPNMLDALKEKDQVLASVYLEGGGFSRTTWYRVGLSNIANGLTRLVLRLPFRTLTSFYRTYRWDALKTLADRFDPLIEETGFICQVELLHKSQLSGLRIAEIPTRVYSERRIGKSKMKLIKTAFQHLRFIMKTMLKH